MAGKLEWIESSGGPLLLAARSSISDWLGVEGSKERAFRTDYDRACSVKDEIGIISVGSKPALVLGDEPGRTAIVRYGAAQDILLVRWRWADSEASLMRLLLKEHSAGTLTFVTEHYLVSAAEDYLLFDSACSGLRTDRYLAVQLQAERYLVETASFKPDHATFAVIHRLRTQPQST